MTLQELFNLIGENPSWVIIYFSLIPLTAILAGYFGRGEGHLTPWRQLYSVLIYLVSIPGIFAITLSIYFFLFERRSILATDVYNQILPVVSMIGTLLLIKQNVDMDRIPGFGKITGLMLMIFSALAIMWALDRTFIHIVAFTYMPFYYVIIIFFALLLAIRYGWSKMFGAK